jgi:hypothetical protein
MDYRKIYNDLMVKAKGEYRTKSSNTYYEAHHIKPKSFGGEGDCRNTKHPNIVLLTPKEHYIAHLLLVNIYPDSPAMYRALWSMCTTKQNVRYSPSSRTYCRIRVEYIKNTIGSNNHFFGKIHTSDSRKKIGIASVGRQTFLGKKHSLETKQKISEFRKGKLLSADCKQKISLSISGGRHYNAKRIECTKTGNIFGSGKELSEYLSIPFSTVRAYLNGSLRKPDWFSYKRIDM